MTQTVSDPSSLISELQDGEVDTIQLTCDITLSPCTIVLGANNILDLNGHTLTFTYNTLNFFNYILEIVDTSISKTGKLRFLTGLSITKTTGILSIKNISIETDCTLPCSSGDIYEGCKVLVTGSISGPVFLVSGDGSISFNGSSIFLGKNNAESIFCINGNAEVLADTFTGVEVDHASGFVKYCMQIYGRTKNLDIGNFLIKDLGMVTNQYFYWRDISGTDIEFNSENGYVATNLQGFETTELSDLNITRTTVEGTKQSTKKSKLIYVMYGLNCETPYTTTISLTPIKNDFFEVSSLETAIRSGSGYFGMVDSDNDGIFELSQSPHESKTRAVELKFNNTESLWVGNTVIKLQFNIISSKTNFVIPKSIFYKVTEGDSQSIEIHSDGFLTKEENPRILILNRAGISSEKMAVSLGYKTLLPSYVFWKNPVSSSEPTFAISETPGEEEPSSQACHLVAFQGIKEKTFNISALINGVSYNSEDVFLIMLYMRGVSSLDNGKDDIPTSESDLDAFTLNFINEEYNGVLISSSDSSFSQCIASDREVMHYNISQNFTKTYSFYLRTGVPVTNTEGMVYFKISTKDPFFAARFSEGPVIGHSLAASSNIGVLYGVTVSYDNVSAEYEDKKFRLLIEAFTDKECTIPAMNGESSVLPAEFIGSVIQEKVMYLHLDDNSHETSIVISNPENYIGGKKITYTAPYKVPTDTVISFNVSPNDGFFLPNVIIPKGETSIGMTLPDSLSTPSTYSSCVYGKRNYSITASSMDYNTGSIPVIDFELTEVDTRGIKFFVETNGMLLDDTKNHLPVKNNGKGFPLKMEISLGNASMSSNVQIMRHQWNYITGKSTVSPVIADTMYLNNTKHAISCAVMLTSTSVYGPVPLYFSGTKGVLFCKELVGEYTKEILLPVVDGGSRFYVSFENSVGTASIFVSKKKTGDKDYQNLELNNEIVASFDTLITDTSSIDPAISGKLSLGSWVFSLTREGGLSLSMEGASSPLVTFLPNGVILPKILP